MSMDNFIQGASHEQVEGLQRIVNQFVHQMNIAMDGQLSALGDTLGILNQNQMAAQQNLQRTLKVAEALAEDARRIQQSSREFALAMENDAQALNRDKQEELLALMRETVKQDNAIARSVTAVQTETIQTLRDIQAQLRRQENDTAAVARAETLTRAIDRMRESVDELNSRLGHDGLTPGRKGKSRRFAGPAEDA